jgi:hypothetical protein
VLFANLKKARPILLNGVSRKGERLVPAASLDSVMRAAFPAESARTKVWSSCNLKLQCMSHCGYQDLATATRDFQLLVEYWFIIRSSQCINVHSKISQTNFKNRF